MKNRLTISQLEKIDKCHVCCIPVGYPGMTFINDNGQILCSECCDKIRMGQLNRETEKNNFLKLLPSIKATSNRYHAVFAYSGGKDSTVALYSAIKDYGLKLLVFNFDNGFKGERVINNIRNVINDLNVDFYQIKSQTSHTITQDINKSIFPCGRCSSLRQLYPMLSQMFDVKYIITGIESVFNNEVIRNRGTYYQVNWPAVFNWDKKYIENRIKDTPWVDPGYGPFDSDCLCPMVALKKIYSSSVSPNIDMYYGKREQHVVPYYARLLRYGAISKDDFYRIICTNLNADDGVMKEYERISNKYGNEL